VSEALSYDIQVKTVLAEAQEEHSDDEALSYDILRP
jgi:hypothetical protein